MKNNNIFYHYTSLDALFNIIEKQALWLFLLKNSNDETEFSFHHDEMDSILKDLFLKEKNNNIKFILSKLVEKGSNTEQYDDYGDYIYGISLTSKRDSIDHWERYGNNSGVCIGINVDIVTSKNNVFLNNLIKENLIYNPDKRAAYVRRNLKYYYDNIIISTLNYINCEFDEQFLTEEDIHHIYNFLYASCKSVFKNDLFSQENEFRIFFNEKVMESIYDKSIDKKRFTYMRNSIRSYYELDIKEIINSLFSEIIIGKSSKQDPEELKLYLSSKGLNCINIEKSNNPIRL